MRLRSTPLFMHGGSPFTTHVLLFTLVPQVLAAAEAAVQIERADHASPAEGGPSAASSTTRGGKRVSDVAVAQGAEGADGARPAKRIRKQVQR